RKPQRITAAAAPLPIRAFRPGRLYSANCGSELVMRFVRTALCGVALLALITPVGAENWVVQIPIQGADGREVMLPLALATRTDAKNSGLAPSHSRNPLSDFAWTLFPHTDASQRIVFMKRGAQLWTVQHNNDE